MLISCTSCESKYLVNSADLKPSGRVVQCAKCGNQWHQESILNIDEQDEQNHNNLKPSYDYNVQKENNNSSISNLPSTYVKEQKVSILNSFLAILFVFISISGFWAFKNLEINNFVLFKFYFEEFLFNLNLIIDDAAKIIYRIFN